MRHTGFNVNEIACLVFDHLLAAVAELVAHFSFNDVKDYFETNMNMRVRNTAGRYSFGCRLAASFCAPVS
jgi:hypothetical protein